MTESAYQSAASSALAPSSSRGKAGSILLGMVLILCGIFAFLAPFTSTLAMTLIIAASATVAGIAQVFQAFQAAAWKGFFFNLLIGIIYVAAGVAFWLNPAIAAITVTFMLAWLLGASGLGEIALGFRLRPERGWQWFVLTGLLTFIGGMWLMFRLPFSGIFVPGVALGLALLFEGVSFVAYGLGRKAPAAPGGGERAAAG